MFKIKCWRNPRENDLKQTLEKVAIRCSNFGKETMIDVAILDTTHQEIITTFVLNTMLNHVGMLWIIENHEELKYDMDINFLDLLTGGTWYNKSICKKLYEKVFKEFIRNARTDRYNIMCSIDAHKK